MTLVFLTPCQHLLYPLFALIRLPLHWNPNDWFHAWREKQTPWVNGSKHISSEKPAVLTLEPRETTLLVEAVSCRVLPRASWCQAEYTVISSENQIFHESVGKRCYLAWIDTELETITKLVHPRSSALESNPQEPGVISLLSYTGKSKDLSFHQNIPNPLKMGTDQQMKYKNLLPDKNRQGYKDWKPDQVPSPTALPVLWMERRYRFTPWEGRHNLEPVSVCSTCVQSFKQYTSPVPFLLLWKISVLKSLLFLIYWDVQ